jgi:general secretion pathway protein B
MSFILDALKKSESDRQRQSGPSLFEVKVAPPRRTLPVWALAIAALLAINVIVISWMLLRRPAAQTPTATSATAPPGGSPASRPVGQDVAARAATPSAASGAAAPAPTPSPPASQSGSAPMPSASSPTPSASTPTPPPVAASSPEPSSTRGASSSQFAGASRRSGGDEAAGADPSDTAPAVEAPAGRASAGAAGAGDDLPLYQQVVGSAGLPELHLDLHVFADRPPDRFVMINMHRLGEGDSLPNGVQVEAIRPDGVVLSYHGTRFLLPRN